MIVSVDYDSTIVADEYPKIGEALPNAKEVMQYLFDRGHELIINSCRTGEAEKQMVGWLRYHKYPYDWVNKNSPRMIKKYGTDTRKISADIHIDDKCLLWYYNSWTNGITHLYDNMWRTIDLIMRDVEKPLVICIVGESGAGKSLVADYFTYTWGVNLIQSYTDRPKRDNKEQGHTFVSETQMDRILLRTEDVLAQTTYSNYRYCCLLDDVRKEANIYVITEDGLKSLQDNWGNTFDIYTIRIHRDEDKRIKSVGKDRVARDEGRYTLPDSYFDYVIFNVTDEVKVLYDSVNEFVKKHRFKGRFEEYITLPQEELIYDDDED
jgi:guanylate kinase